MGATSPERKERDEEKGALFSYGLEEPKECRT